MLKKLNNQGYALILVVFVVALVVTLTSTMLFSLNTEIRLNLATGEKERANYLAQAGIEHALMLVEKNQPLAPLPGEETLLTEGGHTYSYRITELTKEKISATGEIRAGSATKNSITISATIDSTGKVTLN